MNLDAIQVELRPRRGWEAVDLGCSLVRRFAGSVWKAWFLLVLPAQILLAALLWKHPLLAIFILWWFKPFASSVVLQVLSRELFGQRPKMRLLLRTLPMHWLKLAPTFLLGQRLNAVRCFVQPLFELEGNLKRKRRKQRLRALSSYSLCSGQFTTICLVLEPILFFGLLNIGLMAIPESIQEQWFHGFGDFVLTNFDVSAGAHAEWLGLRQLLLVFFLIIMLLIEPFYIGGGFLLYLNARTILEGWDVEVGFKRLSQRLQKLGFVPSMPPAIEDKTPTPPPLPSKSPAPNQVAQNSSPPSNSSTSSSLNLLLLGVLASGIFGLVSFPAQSLANETASLDDYPAKKQAQEILAHEDFEVQTRRIPIPDVEPPPDVQEVELDWLAGLGNILTILFYGFLILVLFALIVWLVLTYVKRRKNAPIPSSGTQITPQATHLVGLDLREESLPDDIPTEARKLWAQDQQREALALLYRGSLAWLQNYGKLPIHSADTEYDCLARLRKLSYLAPVQDYTQMMTQSWIRAAYAENFPHQEQFEHLCAQWPFQPAMANQIQQALARDQAARLAKKTASSTSLSEQLNATATRLLPLLLLLPLFYTSCGNKEQQWEEVDIGYLGEAKRNPFLAASRLLELNGWECQSTRSLHELKENNSQFILAPAASVEDEAATTLLKNAVNQGAHLCLLLEDGEPWINTFLREPSSNDYSLPEESKLAIWLEELDIEIEYYRSSDTISEVTLLGQSYQLWQPTSLSFEFPEYEQETAFIKAEQETSPTLASMDYGYGRITLLASGAAFRNEYLTEKDHAQLFLELASLSNSKVDDFAYLAHPQFNSSFSSTPQALIMLRSEANFFRLLWQHAWPAILGGIFALCLLLWARMPRRQPVAQELDQGMRYSVEDQLVGMGSFFWNHGQRDDLLGALRRRVLSAWRSAYPLSPAAKTLASQLEEQEQVQLAQHANLPLDQVRHALQEHHGELSASDLESIIRTLQYLNASLDKSTT